MEAKKIAQRAVTHLSFGNRLAHVRTQTCKHALIRPRAVILSTRAEELWKAAIKLFSHYSLIFF